MNETTELRQVSLVFLVDTQERSVLLAMKKRGFGQGKWNGTGGKPEEGETVEASARRETLEEIGVVVGGLELRVVSDFFFPHNIAWSQRVLTYFCTSWQGEPVETEEMNPQWFSFDGLPFDLMWPDDVLWLPRALDGEILRGRFVFNEAQQMIEHNVRAVNRADLLT